MDRTWRVHPLRSANLGELIGLIPCAMWKLLKAKNSEEIKSISPKKVTCQNPSEYSTRDFDNVWAVKPQLGDVCLCKLETQQGAIMAGTSHCKTTIIINNNKCITSDGKSITCPGDDDGLRETTAGTVWVCGQTAFHSLPKKWVGCCYPGLLDVGTEVYFNNENKDYKQSSMRPKRSLADEKIPLMFQGTKLWDPWTSRISMTGWSFLIGGGTAASLLKINGLAWQVLRLANKTEDALNQLNTELKGIREAVIQHRLVLDMITAERGAYAKC